MLQIKAIYKGRVLEVRRFMYYSLRGSKKSTERNLTSKIKN